MLRICLSVSLVCLTASLANSARASGCCFETKQWKIAQRSDDGYSNSVVLAPGNDTRVNLLLLIADRNRASGLPMVSMEEQAKREESYFDYPSTNESRLFRWRSFRARLAPPVGNQPQSLDIEQDPCSSAAIATFQAGISVARGIDEAEKARLVAFRQSIEQACSAHGILSAIAIRSVGFSKVAQPFAVYIEAAQAFNMGDDAGSIARFAQLYQAEDPWVRETATYMLARGLLRLASEGAIDEYGSVRPAEKKLADKFDRAERAMRLYLRRYPKGRYATSMRGLFRRLYWLKSDQAALAAEYQALFALRDPAKRGLSDVELAEEIDNKLLGYYPFTQKPADIKDPVLLAVLDLANMRTPGYAESDPIGEPRASAIDRAALEAQRPFFAGEPALFDFLLASYAFHIDRRPAEVLTLIPDAARQERFSYLEFSRQMLRGLALDATKDPNARSFWRDMVRGATQPYQQEALQIAIAMSAERRGDVASLFAADSPVRDPFVRKMILAYVAGPDLLRRQAVNSRLSLEEREFALFTLLYKDLAQARHQAFLSDVALITPDMGRGDKVNFSELERDSLRTRLPALEEFRKPYGLFACPPLPETVRKLAKSPRFAAGQLCVAEFMRVHSLFDFLLDTPMPKDQLGGGQSQFPGAPYSRLEAYKAVIASPTATANDKAYALYRAVICYDNGSNDCGGVEVDQSQRAAWFRRLKQDYPATRWAKMADYYW